ncbi:MAG: cysteine desulfurase NifS [Spirochaetes bacterium RBG_13_51_14]|nr:MAG: cysteine desulfurase NifS [Spirochaetes bacterium RBG_13_51_14]
MNRIYLDHAATTPILPEVCKAMMPHLSDEYGNPSSLHAQGRRARETVEVARDIISVFIEANPGEIIFTGGGSESNNLAIKGTAFSLRGRGNHIITTAVEHHSVIESCRFLESLGFDVTYIGVDSAGMVDPDEVGRAITRKTILVSVIHGNNEIGTIQPVAEIARIARGYGVPVHTDAVQTFGHIPLSVDDLGIDLLSATAHKLYGPKGTGLLYIRSGTAIEPLIHGGGQETHFRAGTHNVAGITGFGRAVEMASGMMDEESERIARLRDSLIERILCNVGGVINGHEHRGLPGIISLTIPGIDADALVIALDRMGIACSSGAACMSSNFEPSHVLTAIGRSREEAKSTIRLSLGRDTNHGEIERASDALVAIVPKLRKFAP